MRNRAICWVILEKKLAMGGGQKAKHTACLAKGGLASPKAGLPRQRRVYLAEGGLAKNSPDGFSIRESILSQKVSQIEHPLMRDSSGC
jgi:hypothetical protein